MRFRARLALATAAMTLVTLCLSFWAVAFAWNHRDAAFLERAMLGLLAVAAAWSSLLPARLIRRLSHEQQAMARLGLVLESQRRFVAEAAHELRAPITVVHGQLALALRRPRGEPEYRFAIEEALGSAAQLRTLTEELLDLARAGASSAGPFEPTSVAGAARGAARFVQAAADRAGVTLDLRVEDVFVSGRTTDLERMLRNLLENAVRHSPSPGRVVVEVAAAGGVVEIAVSDQGSGVPEAERPRLFEPFFRGAGAQGSRGAGLGLAIVREIARAHGGDVHLDTTAKAGARFVVRLPMQRWPIGEIPRPATAAAALHAS